MFMFYSQTGEREMRMTMLACGLIRWDEARGRDKNHELADWLSSRGVCRTIRCMRDKGRTSTKLDVPLKVRGAFGWPTSRVILVLGNDGKPVISPICEIPA